MISRSYIIKTPNGLHARPAAELIKIAQKNGCELFMKIDGQWTKAGIINLLLLGASEGAELSLGVEGAKAEECLEEMAQILEA